METTYFKTSHYIRHEGNVVDLGTYRRKLAAVSGEDWRAVRAPEFDEEERSAPDTGLYVLEPEEAPGNAARKRKHRGGRAALCLDMGASMAVIALTLTALVQFLRLL